jgi:hypothetical protein
VCENSEKKPQVPPLRFAAVGMTILSWGQVFLAKALAGATQLSSRPERSVVEGPAVSFPSSHTRSKARNISTFMARPKSCPDTKQSFFRSPQSRLLRQNRTLPQAPSSFNFNFGESVTHLPGTFCYPRSRKPYVTNLRQPPQSLIQVRDQVFSALKTHREPKQ